MRPVQKQAMKFTDQPAEDAQPTNNALPPFAAWCRIHSPSGVGEQERAFQEMLFNMMALSWSL